MKISISIILCCVSGILLAQHVTDDAVYYTPIPRPIAESKKVKSFNQQVIDDTTKQSRYYLSIHSGYLFGCKSCDGERAMSSSFAVINGLKIGAKGRVGIGVSYDSYWRFQVLPVFASASWDLIGNGNTKAFFLQLNYGQSLAWQHQAFQEYGFDRTNGGRMIFPQIGYRIKYHSLNIALLAGIKMQRVFTDYQFPTWYWVDNAYQQGNNYSTVKQDINRLALTLAVGWR